MWTVSEAPEVLTALGSLLGGTAALVAACTAYRGINVWKKQLDTDLARRLAAAVYQHRKSLLRITFPDVSVEERNIDNAPQGNFGPNSDVYWRRFSQSKSFLSDVETILAEAELRWGTAVKEKYEPIETLQLELVRNIIKTSANSGKKTREAILAAHEADEYLKDLSYKETCQAALDINAAFEPIQQFLKEKI